MLQLLLQYLSKKLQRQTSSKNYLDNWICNKTPRLCRGVFSCYTFKIVDVWAGCTTWIGCKNWRTGLMFYWTYAEKSLCYVQNFVIICEKLLFFFWFWIYRDLLRSYVQNGKILWFFLMDFFLYVHIVWFKISHTKLICKIKCYNKTILLKYLILNGCKNLYAKILV